MVMKAQRINHILTDQSYIYVWQDKCYHLWCRTGNCYKLSQWGQQQQAFSKRCNGAIKNKT